MGRLMSFFSPQGVSTVGATGSAGAFSFFLASFAALFAPGSPHLGFSFTSLAGFFSFSFFFFFSFSISFGLFFFRALIFSIVFFFSLVGPQLLADLPQAVVILPRVPLGVVQHPLEERQVHPRAGVPPVVGGHLLQLAVPVVVAAGEPAQLGVLAQGAVRVKGLTTPCQQPEYERHQPGAGAHAHQQGLQPVVGAVQGAVRAVQQALEGRQVDSIGIGWKLSLDAAKLLDAPQLVVLQGRLPAREGLEEQGGEAAALRLVVLGDGALGRQLHRLLLERRDGPVQGPAPPQRRNLLLQQSEAALLRLRGLQRWGDRARRERPARPQRPRRALHPRQRARRRDDVAPRGYERLLLRPRLLR
mmetsp:Transcript_25262/g.66754  ORF Transcript_25262/g.66754 Transcript_25262/m.66754 type:complete len:359 (+) Transcript_25262:3074-4150(+)